MTNAWMALASTSVTSPLPLRFNRSASGFVHLLHGDNKASLKEIDRRKLLGSHPFKLFLKDSPDQLCVESVLALSLKALACSGDLPILLCARSIATCLSALATTQLRLSPPS